MRITLTGLALLCVAGPPAAQAQHDGHDTEMAAMSSGVLSAGPHLTVTPRWAASAGDAARADSVVQEARDALARYADVGAAERDGYRMFAPKLKRQKVYHYSLRSNAVRSMSAFDPTRPTALLYQPQPNGSVRLIGAMYTAPASLSLEELNERIPLSVAQWHQHTNICVPPGGLKAWKAGSRDKRFGPGGSITTEEACTAAGGTFRAGSRTWMVHANVFLEGAAVWEHKH